MQRPLLGLDIGLPVEHLAPVLRDALAGRTEDAHATLEAVNRRGHRVLVDTTVRPLVGQDGSGPVVRGAIILMRDRPLGDGGGANANGGAPRDEDAAASPAAAEPV